MTRLWLGLWLLSASWFFGVEYYFPRAWGVWLTLVGLGTAAFCFSQRKSSLDAGPGRWFPAVLSLALVPVMFWLPWPFRAAPLLMGAGLLFGALEKAGPGRRALAEGATIAGLLLFVQALALWSYQQATARTHELPWPLPQFLTRFINLLGVEAATDGSHLILPTMRENHALATTWELLLDPATVCFVVGGFFLLLLSHAEGQSQSQPKPAAGSHTSTAASVRKGKGGERPSSSARWWQALRFPRPMIGLSVAVLCWLPVRAALLCAFLLHRALRTDYEAPLNLMSQFWSPWTHLLLLLPLALLVALWTVRSKEQMVRGLSRAVQAGGLAVRGQPWRTWVGAFVTALVLSLAVLWDPIGTRKPGRIAVDEFHSRWEPTARPMDTEWYGHLSGYNYACLYDLCSKLYDMSRLTNALTDANLAGLDVLILKVPTERFAAEEVDAIVRYVERGGGLLLIGEHTDVFSTGYNLNTVSRRFGFQFRYDCLFGVQSFFDQFYMPWVSPHPVLRYLPYLDFATSCSIDPGTSRGRGVIVSAGLKNSLADYHANNYYPQAVDHAGMQYGAFVQLWSVRHGRGRVLAFTDSTIFSNFSTFEPGKRELLVGMLEWLNHQARLGDPRLWLGLCGLGLLGWTARLHRRTTRTWPALIVSAVLGWTAVGVGLRAYQQRALPEPKPLRPCTWVTIDRTVCDTPLSKGGFIGGKPDGFGIFERWILRLGYFIKRDRGSAAFSSDAVVFFYPTKAVSGAFRDELVRYVEQGGKVLVIDSPKNEKSTAASLLEPFGLSLRLLPGQSGTLAGPADWPAVPVEAAHELVGGRALFSLGGKTVGAVARRGKGLIVAVGFGSRFADTNMGTTGDVEPDAALRKVFDLQFALLRALMQDKFPPVDNP